MFNIGSDGHSIISELHLANYGPKVAMPRLVARYMPTRDWKDVIDGIYKMAQVGFMTADDPTESQLRGVFKLRQRDKRTERPRGQNQSANNSPNPAPKDGTTKL